MAVHRERESERARKLVAIQHKQANMCSANENNGTATPPPVALSQNPSDYGNNLKIIDSNDQIKELQTIIRDK